LIDILSFPLDAALAFFILVLLFEGRQGEVRILVFTVYPFSEANGFLDGRCWHLHETHIGLHSDAPKSVRCN
jgi:hypothetical protein